LNPKGRADRIAGNARQGQIDEAKAAGMDDVVIKPYRLDDLLQKIENMMRIRNSRNTIDAVTGSAVETPDEVDVQMGQ
jgi:CheY-like chemotaxis protein